jgi:hypothetical protein
MGRQGERKEGKKRETILGLDEPPKSSAIKTSLFGDDVYHRNGDQPRDRDE